ncbi:MAG: NapC/NirT family cytochrome c [Planctomycetota bacterium]|nr:NapC/NirT family cytochrome c [Planctomycetota bacterium]
MSADQPDATPESQAEDQERLITEQKYWEQHWATSGTPWQRVRWYAARVVAVVGALMLLTATVTAFTGWYTSRSEFCSSCHIMDPYYASWQESPHGNVSCIKCHFPPGAGEKVRGKMMGLVQLVKYVTRSQGPRPVAEVSDASCLRSGCHDTRLLAGRVEYQGIQFDHTPHLQELRGGKKLRCTSCHGQVVQGSHISVTTSTCFLCHFKDQHFNEGTGACTRCHQIPEKEFDLGGGVKFSHNLAYERGVDCTSCHGDLIRGNGEVPVERCGVCHNRPEDLKRIDDHVLMHQKHVTEHKVDCLDCHLEIHHAADEHRILHAASNCSDCHPNHHHEQVDLLLGLGAKSVAAQPSSMTMARITCRSCHNVRDVSPTGTVLWKASIQTCTTCHDSSAAERLQTYHDTLRSSLGQIDANLKRVRDELPASGADAARLKEITAQLRDLEHDLNFLRVGNGVHNIHYADALTRSLIEELVAVCRELKIEEPEIVLPDAPKTEKP